MNKTIKQTLTIFSRIVLGILIFLGVTIIALIIYYYPVVDRLYIRPCYYYPQIFSDCQ